MSFDIFPSHEIFTGFEFTFSGTRVFDGTLTPVEFRLKLEVAPLDDAERSSAVSNSYVKFKYFVDQVLSNSVFIERLDEWSAATFVDLESGFPTCMNNLVMCESAPTNMTILKTLHSKFRALACNGLDVGFIQLSSSDCKELNITSIGDPVEELPNMNDWLGSEKTYFSKPWWARDDASTMDVIPAEDANLAEPPEFAYNLAFLLEEPEVDEDAPPKVVRLEFRPRLIQGGKTD